MSEGRGESLRRLRELEAANRQLARERDDLRVLIDTPRNAMLFSFDLNYNYIAFNQAHREFVKHNWSLDIHPGMHVFDILSDPEERAAAGEQNSKLAREFGVSRETLYQYLRLVQ